MQQYRTIIMMIVKIIIMMIIWKSSQQQFSFLILRIIVLYCCIVSFFTLFFPFIQIDAGERFFDTIRTAAQFQGMAERTRAVLTLLHGWIDSTGHDFIIQFD